MCELMLESDVAALLHRSRRFVRELRQAGELRWLPGAGRAPILITRESVNQYIKRKTQCHASNSHRDLSSPTMSGMSPTRTLAARKEQAFGQKIYKSRRQGFRAG